jgi:ABC-type lipoprotein export system ATPase subunit
MNHDAVSMPSLEINRPGLVAITGPSGAGKSTLLELLAGTLTEQYSGSVQVLGKEWSGLRGDRTRQMHLRRIGLIPQDLGLLPNQTPRQMLRQALLDADMPKSDLDDRILRALTRMDLAAYADRRIAELSGGQKQRVAIARALARNVELILADEPTANLNTQLADETVAVLKQIGQTIPVVIVTHDPRVAQLCGEQVRLSPPSTMPTRIAPVAPPSGPGFRKLAVLSGAAGCAIVTVVTLLITGPSATVAHQGPAPLPSPTAVAASVVPPPPLAAAAVEATPVPPVALVAQAAVHRKTTPRVAAAPVPPPAPPAPPTPVVAVPVAPTPSPQPVTSPTPSYLQWWMSMAQLFGGNPGGSGGGYTPPQPTPSPRPSP